jgi:hypothetical protein
VVTPSPTGAAAFIGASVADAAVMAFGSRGQSMLPRQILNGPASGSIHALCAPGFTWASR